MTDPGPTPSTAESAPYRSLYKYLDNRFADTVVLTFAQIESLIGFALPDLARLRKEWWSNASEGGVTSTQSSSWVQANRTATPNLLAQSVTFERSTS